MPVSVVVGGQYGSEGKGKVSEWLARERGATHAIRVGGPNSGHTVIDRAGKTWVFRQLPTAVVNPNVIAVIGAGSFLDLEVLGEEIHAAKIEPDRLIIHPRAVVIEVQDKISEASGLTSRIGSTGSGTGAALRRRNDREEGVRFAADIGELKPFVRDATRDITQACRRSRVVLEGTQGFGLSVLFGTKYPYVTSRDTTAAAFLSEAGISPLDVDELALVLRCHPIRVAGNSGPLPNEFDWNALSSEGRLERPVGEFTTVTKRLRRVARFDSTVVCEAIAINAPTLIVLNHLDYVAPEERAEFVDSVERDIAQRVDFVGLSSSVLEDRRSLLKVV